MPNALTPKASAPTTADGGSARGRLSAVPAPHPAPNDGAILDAEKLVAYHLALELQVLCSQLVPADQRVLRDQLERASVSVVCNVAESAGRRSRKDKRRFVVMARGSATESAALIDILRIRGLASLEACREARSLVVRVVQVLTKLEAALV